MAWHKAILWFVIMCLFRVYASSGLQLNYNRFTGSIPLELCSLVGLTYLNLNDNKLDGSIPDCIGNLVHLQWVPLFANAVTELREVGGAVNLCLQRLSLVQ